VKTNMAVDDSLTIRMMTSLVLRNAGYEVIEDQDAVEALAKMKGRTVDLVLTDVNMPKMSGLEFARQLRATEFYKFVPIVLLTTESDAQKKLEGKAAGATTWIVKPFNPEQLLAIVKKVMR
jgi:two-component system chemotaxis response regulator CheY